MSSVPETCSDSAFPVWYGTNADRRNRSRRPPNNSSSSPISFSLPQPGIVPPSGNNFTVELALTVHGRAQQINELTIPNLLAASADCGKTRRRQLSRPTRRCSAPPPRRRSGRAKRRGPCSSKEKVLREDFENPSLVAAIKERPKVWMKQGGRRLFVSLHAICFIRDRL